jgi:hypothetical protein
VAAVRAEEDIEAGPAMMGHAGARVPWLALDLAGEQLGQEREVDRQARFPGRAAVGVVLGREPVEGAPELAELPLDVDGVLVGVLAFQADRLTPAHLRARALGPDESRALIERIARELT